MFGVVDTFVRTFDRDRTCVFLCGDLLKTYFFFHSMVCDDNLMLSKLLYLHVIYYNVIGQDPSHDTYFNLTNILKKK